MKLTNIVQNLDTFNSIFKTEFSLDTDINGMLGTILSYVVENPSVLDDPNWDYDSVAVTALKNIFNNTTSGDDNFNSILNKMIEENYKLITKPGEPQVVITLQDVKDFLSQVIDKEGLGMGFHIDTNFVDYVDSNGFDLFGISEANAFQEKLNMYHDWCDANGVDIYQLALDIMGTEKIFGGDYANDIDEEDYSDIDENDVDDIEEFLHEVSTPGAITFFILGPKFFTTEPDRSDIVDALSNVKETLGTYFSRGEIFEGQVAIFTQQYGYDDSTGILNWVEESDDYALFDYNSNLPNRLELIEGDANEYKDIIELTTDYGNELRNFLDANNIYVSSDTSDSFAFIEPKAKEIKLFLETNLSKIAGYNSKSIYILPPGWVLYTEIPSVEEIALIIEEFGTNFDWEVSFYRIEILLDQKSVIIYQNNIEFNSTTYTYILKDVGGVCKVQLGNKWDLLSGNDIAGFVSGKDNWNIVQFVNDIVENNVVGESFESQKESGVSGQIQLNGNIFNVVLTESPENRNIIDIQFFNDNQFVGDAEIYLEDGSLDIDSIEWTLPEYNVEIDPDNELQFNVELYNLINLVPFSTNLEQDNINTSEISFDFVAYQEDEHLSVGAKYDFEGNSELPGFDNDGETYFKYWEVQPGESLSVPEIDGLTVTWDPVGWSIKANTGFNQVITYDGNWQAGPEEIEEDDYLETIYHWLNDVQNTHDSTVFYLIGNNPPINTLGTFEEFQAYVVETLGVNWMGASHIRIEVVENEVNIYEIFDHMIEQNGGEIDDSWSEPITITYLGNNEWIDSDDMVGRLGLDDSLQMLDQNLVDYFKSIFESESVSPDMSEDFEDLSVDEDFIFQSDFGTTIKLHLDGKPYNCIVEKSANNKPNVFDIKLFDGNEIAGSAEIYWIDDKISEVYWLEGSNIDTNSELSKNQHLIDLLEIM